MSWTRGVAILFELKQALRAVYTRGRYLNQERLQLRYCMPVMSTTVTRVSVKAPAEVKSSHSVRLTRNERHLCDQVELSRSGDEEMQQPTSNSGLLAWADGYRWTKPL